MPLLIGPGAISAVVLFASEAQTKYGLAGMGAGAASILAISLICLLVFLASGVISRLLGKVGAMIVVRVLGLILTALAVQFIIVGVSDTTAGIIRRSVANPYPAAAPRPARAPAVRLHAEAEAAAVLSASGPSAWASRGSPARRASVENCSCASRA